jgi:aminopeptidase N
MAFPLLAAAVLAAAVLAAAPPIHHHLIVELDPASHAIAVSDTITAPKDAKLPDLPSDALPLDVAHAKRIDARTIRLRYAATIEHPISREGEDYARGFAETEGTIGPEGAFLGGSSHWYASWGGDGLVTFDLDVTLPPGWDAMSQGRRVQHERSETGTHVRFVSDDPQEEIWLVAGPWLETARKLDTIDALAMLRTKDDALAATYLDATGPYVAMYSKLLGPYPYSKFALVENFWETGYGMPSFTLLGPSVLRLPFIVTTSYPHEILHDWWGNGVFVLSARGNWSEGLTAYLADHLSAEQKGGGAGYRQEALQKFADYASRSKDFPLREFKERHSPSTEAVGYGKALMLFHMIRREIGDPAFLKELQSFYASFKFRRASFDELLGALGATRFTPWVDRAGAPALAVREVAASPTDSGYRLTGTIAQTQSGDPWPLAVPVAVTLDGREAAWQGSIRSTSKGQSFALDLPARPVRLDVDPEFDLFRALDPAEIPPALSGAFGAESAVAVIPSKAPADLASAYRALVEEWNHGRPAPIRVVTDAEIESVPGDAAVWLLGWENRFLGGLAPEFGPYGASISPASMHVSDGDVARAGHAVVAVVRHAGHPVAVVAADSAAQVPGLARKLPHYHKYSYLAFEGDEPKNTIKGRWPVVGSPLTVVLDPAGSSADVPMGRLAPRAALAELPPPFSKDRMLATVRALSAPGMNGRAIGSPEIDRAAASIADAMREAGLEPAGGAPGDYFQAFEAASGSKTIALRNVVGSLRGTKTEWANDSVVVAAHFDHLGPGHPGADDDASGVAILLELAKTMAAGPRPLRSIVFVAFSGEESGFLGSKNFVATRPGGATTFAMVDLDTVGRLGNGKILVLGAGSADEWKPIVDGAGYVTGAPVQAVVNDPGGSDQTRFLAAGVPAVQLFTGAHADYHAAGDTADKIDGDGLVKVAAVTREIVAYLAGRDRPLTARIAGGAPAAPAPSGERRASLGGIPDYGFEGPGVRITGTVPGSPAEKAGLKDGDVIVSLGAVATTTMREFSDALKARAPGDRVEVTVLRDGKKTTVDVVLGSR